MATGADGVNLDFEPMPAEARDDFTLFVRELRSVLDAAQPELQITFDITASVDQYDIAALTADDAADAVFLMAYDYIGNSATHAASHSPLDEPVTGFDIRNTVADLLAVADPAHTILGLPWYGRAWTTKGPEAGLAHPDRQEPDRPGLLLVRRRGRHRARQRPQLRPRERLRLDGLCPQGLRHLSRGLAPGLVRRCRWLRDQGPVRAGPGHAGHRHVGAWLHRRPAGYVDGHRPRPSAIARTPRHRRGRPVCAPGPLGSQDGLPVADGPVTVDLRGDG